VPDNLGAQPFGSQVLLACRSLTQFAVAGGKSENKSRT
jgi:hypothetical protein